MEYELKVERLKTERAIRSSSRPEMMMLWTRSVVLETEHSWECCSRNVEAGPGRAHSALTYLSTHKCVLKHLQSQGLTYA